MIETKLDELIAALNANTEALKAAGITATPAAAPKTRGKAKETPPVEEAPAKGEAPAPAPTPAPAPASKGPTANDLKKYVKNERTRLSEVSQEAVKKHKEESAKILKKYGLTDFTSIPEDKVVDILADFKALNVEQPKDDLEDDDLKDDNDGL